MRASKHTPTIDLFDEPTADTRPSIHLARAPDPREESEALVDPEDEEPGDFLWQGMLTALPRDQTCRMPRSGADQHGPA